MSDGVSSDEEDDKIFAFDHDEFPPKEQSSVTSLTNDYIPDINRLTETDQVLAIEDFVASDIKQIKNTVSLEDFAVLSVIGKGAYGQVFLVQKKVSNEYYAMKVLKKATIVLHTKDTEHTKNERSVLEEIRHPFIVKLYFAFQTPSRLYLILNYASGGELFTYLTKERMFSEDVARFYISELLLALQHLHSIGIIYRDLKPENVMLDGEGHLMLTDFGLSKVAINAQTVCGTVEFMAPEIIDEKVAYTKSVDYWSMGIMLYDMLTGAPPFSGGNRKKIMEGVLKKKPNYPKYMTSQARDLCTKLLKKDPQHRLGSGPNGAEEIKKHAFFKKTNWTKLFNREITPPYVPDIKCPEDTSNFSAEFTNMSIEGSFAPHDVPLGDHADLFRGFSFVAMS